MKMQWYILILVFGIGIQHGQCQDIYDLKNLKEQLFVTDEYDSKLRPVYNQTSAIDVWVNLYLVSIHELNEATETLKISAYLWIIWNDEFLVWNATAYGGIEQLYIPQGDVWKPDVALRNSVKQFKELGVTTLNVKVDMDGWVEWYPFEVFETSCSVDITYFPFDTQECKIMFVPWSYGSTDVAMKSEAGGIVLRDYEANSAWDVVNTGYYFTTSSGDSTVVFTIKLRRKPLNVLLSVILPIMMLAILNLFVFVLPCECGEKASYAITVFLAFAVFLTIVSASFPENSETVAIFSVYLIIQTLQSTIITLIALALTRFLSFDSLGKPVPNMLQKLLKLLTLRNCCKKPCKETKVENIKVVEVREGSTGNDDEGQDDDDKPQYNTWKQAVDKLDFVFFLFFTLVLVMSTLTLFVIAVTNKN
ncbi:neuronal acetylcholine receptor subunit alpha-7-like [Ruditapes philippinarum]|uniref:neuronal acetylcholine receptor subunit alpha-7-like n=1 Tax=Ruditapes philippinarum TaxID=129788 RepID=UPI00295BC112|nr:neuronal acetylcholine receptor subunit alpha-7-like [Ruditapes philippinarum]